MSCKGSRLARPDRVEPFEWYEHGAPRSASPPRAFDRRHQTPEPANDQPDPAACERDAFAKGFAQGERAGADAAAARGDAMLRRLAQTFEEMVALRATMIQKTERQVVQLALAIAARVIHREVNLDRELLVAMARVALDRLGDASSATIRLHPDEHAAIVALRGGDADGAVRLVADPSVARGGCLVQSDFGQIDVSVDAQISELATTLLASEEPQAPDDAPTQLER
jgi:flagellar assembly protein FliH